jgi:hypothetical protein
MSSPQIAWDGSLVPIGMLAGRPELRPQLFVNLILNRATARPTTRTVSRFSGN